MSQRIERNPNLWTVIISTSDAEPFSELEEEQGEERRPKQYRPIQRKRSTLQHVIDRADRLSDPARRFLVVPAHHREEVSRQLADRAHGRVLYQPIDRGTAPAAFLALCEIAWRDPEATVVLYPANHFLSPEEASVDLVASAVRLSAELPERPVLLGVRPEGWETENGWVQPSTMVPSWSAGNGVRARDVVRFIAKPTMETAAELAREQALWSTGILVGRLATLWRLGWRYLPEIMLPWLYAGTDRPGETLEDVYLEMPVRDLSRDLLQYAASNLVVMEAKDLHWSAWEYLSILQRTLAGLERNENRTRDDSQIDTRPQSPGT